MLKIKTKSFLLCCSLLGISSVYAEEAVLDRAIKQQDKVTSQAIRSQKKIDALSDASIELRQEIASKRRELENLEVYNRYLEKSASRQDALIQDKKRQLESITVLQKDIVPLMLRMLSSMEQFIQQDKPFLLKERLEQLAEVRAVIHRSDKTVAEKYRRVLELYQQESEYGRSISSYTDEVELGGKPQLVEMLRIGRLGLYFRTLDKSSYGHWNSSTMRWEELPGEYGFELDKAYKVAAKRSTPELLSVPLVKYVGAEK